MSSCFKAAAQVAAQTVMTWLLILFIEAEVRAVDRRCRPVGYPLSLLEGRELCFSLLLALCNPRQSSGRPVCAATEVQSQPVCSGGRVPHCWNGPAKARIELWVLTACANKE